jgi:hypothetical protein
MLPKYGSARLPVMRQFSAWHLGHSSVPGVRPRALVSSISTRLRSASISSGAAVMRRHAGQLFRSFRMESSDIKAASAPPKFGELYAFKTGLRRMAFHEDASLQVCTVGGRKCVTVTRAGCESLIFELDSAQRDHLVALLAESDGAERATSVDTALATLRAYADEHGLTGNQLLDAFAVARFAAGILPAGVADDVPVLRHVVPSPSSTGR